MCAGLYSNLRVNQARTRIIEDLKNAGLLSKEENIMHRTPLCERSKTPIEIIPLQDYFVKAGHFHPAVKRVTTKIKFHPETHKQILLNWLDSVAIDWPVSRRRFYGTEIPIWYCNNCKTPNLPKPVNIIGHGKKLPFERCNKCANTEFIGEDRTFDTWMDSSITPLFITKYKSDQEFYKHTYPTEIRPQAKDIIRTWLYYTMPRCYQLTGQLAWSDAWIMGYGVDEKGEKMSKSKGNVIDPFPIVHRYGADTFRFWSAIEANLGHDFRCSEQRILSAQKFLSKLWNLGRFLSSFDFILEALYMSLPPQINGFLQNCQIWLKNAKKVMRILTSLFRPMQLENLPGIYLPAHYVEMVKGRVYDINDSLGQKSAIFTLHKCLSTILKLLAPLCPFITEEALDKDVQVRKAFIY